VRPRARAFLLFTVLKKDDVHFGHATYLYAMKNKFRKIKEIQK